MNKILLLMISILGCVPLCTSAQKTADSVYACPPCGSSCDTLSFNKAGICPHCHMTLNKTVSEGLSSNKQQLTICFYLQDGVEILDFAGPLEVFSYAGFTIFTVTKGKEPIRTQGLLNLLPDFTLDNAPPFDILAVFGGNASKVYQDSSVMQWLQSRRSTTQYFFSVCTGAFILASMGILDGHSATTFHLSLESLQTQFPKITVLPNARFVDNGRLITTAGISAGIDGALHLVAKLKGEPFAARIAQMIEYDKWQPREGRLIESNKQSLSSKKAIHK